MSKIEVVDDIYNLQELPEVDTSTTERKWVEIFEDQGSTLNANQTVLKYHTRELNAYYALHEAYLDILARVTDDGAAYTADENIAPVSDAGARLFENGKLRIANKIVEQKSEYMGMGAYILGLVQNSWEKSKTAASNQFMYPDTGSGGSQLTHFTQTMSHTHTHLLSDAADGTGAPAQAWLKTSAAGVVSAFSDAAATAAVNAKFITNAASTTAPHNRP